MNHVTQSRRLTKIKLIEYKGGQCEVCGYNKRIPSAYDFHHSDPREKIFGISNGNTLGIETMKKEVDKCILLCKNCHAEIHDTIIDVDILWDKALQQTSNGKIFTKMFTCNTCGKIEKQRAPNQKYCGYDCSSVGRRKVENRPTKEEILKMLDTETRVSLGKKFKVSETTIRDWIK